MARVHSQDPTQTLSRRLPENIKFRIHLLWAKGSTALYRPLSINVLREVSEFIAFRLQLPVVKGTNLVIFDATQLDFRSIDLMQLRLPIQYSSLGQCVCVGEDLLFMCGGDEIKQKSIETTSAAFVINATRATRVRDMSIPRRFFSLYYYDVLDTVFLYGSYFGSAKNRRKCEQYNIAKDLWSPLPNMSALDYCYHICGYQGKVYLLGGSECYCEVFTIATKEFSAFPGKLKPIISGNCIAVWNDQLIIFQEDSARKWDLNSGNFIKDIQLSKRFTAEFSMVYKNNLYCINSLVGFSLNLSTMTFGSFISLDNGEIW